MGNIWATFYSIWSHCLWLAEVAGCSVSHTSLTILVVATDRRRPFGLALVAVDVVVSIFSSSISILLCKHFWALKITNFLEITFPSCLSISLSVEMYPFLFSWMAKCFANVTSFWAHLTHLESNFKKYFLLTHLTDFWGKPCHANFTVLFHCMRSKNDQLFHTFIETLPACPPSLSFSLTAALSSLPSPRRKELLQRWGGKIPAGGEWGGDASDVTLSWSLWKLGPSW